MSLPRWGRPLKVKSKLVSPMPRQRLSANTRDLLVCKTASLTIPTNCFLFLTTMKTPPVIKIETLDARWHASVQVPREQKLAALALQHGQPTAPDPIATAVAYRASMRKASS